MKTFTSFDGIQIAYHDEGEGPDRLLSSCMEGMSMGSASSESSSAFCPFTKNCKRCSEKCLAEHFRFPILHSKDGRVLSGRFWRPVRAPSCRTCVGSEPPTNLERKARTQIQRWPGTSLLSFSTLVLIPRM